MHTETGARAAAAIRSSLVDGNHDLGLVVASSDVSVDATLVRGTLARASDGGFGDGVVVVAAGGPASAVVSTSRVEGSARAGLASFGAHVSLGTTALECNTIQLDSEPFVGQTPTFEDLGGNVCGCAGEESPCQVLSTSLTPPEPLAAE